MEPDDVQDFLQRLFAALDRLQSKLSERWREHSNRRTIAILTLGGLLIIAAYMYAIRPPDNFPLEHLVTIPSGTSVYNTGELLKEAGVVRSAYAFRILLLVIGHNHVVHAGDYLFKEPLDIFSVVRTVSIGAYGLEPIHMRVPEGATIIEMAAYFSKRLERFNTERFLVETKGMEGYLFPDTYFFLPNATDETIVQTMRQNFDTHIATIQDQMKAFGKPLSDVVIVASILEREAPPGEDRRIIADIIWRRLKLGMPLQVDVTFLYTIGKGTFQITKKDLATDSPYNTYKNKGLPPTPIGSPSIDSLKAAVNPIKSNYLYFLADGNGVTHYSKTFEGQVENKNKYF